LAHFSGSRIVVIAFFAWNSALGITYGSFGPLITTFQQQFGVSRGVVSVAIGLVSVSLGICSPLIGIALQRWPVRSVMITGAFLNLFGYLLLSIMSHMWEIIVIYGLLIGSGISALSYIPGSTLISRWFVRDRGKALGIMCMPLLGMLMPLMTSAVLVKFGMSAVFLINAVLFALLVPLLLLIIERPEDVGQLPRGVADHLQQEAIPITGPEFTTRNPGASGFLVVQHGGCDCYQCSPNYDRTPRALANWPRHRANYGCSRSIYS